MKRESLAEASKLSLLRDSVIAKEVTKRALLMDNRMTRMDIEQPLWDVILEGKGRESGGGRG